MANVKITELDGRVFEVSGISIAEVRELVSPNGNGHTRIPTQSKKPKPVKMFDPDRKPGYSKFKNGLSGLAKKFFVTVQQSPNGIQADFLAEKLGFRSTNQIGGVTGGGIGKLARKLNIKQDDLYTKEVTREDGRRVVIYKPGPEIDKVL